MDEPISAIRTHLDVYGELTEVILNAISLLFIIAGVVISLVKSIQERLRMSHPISLHMHFRMMFGGWLIVALEFQLAADIVGE